MIVLDVNETLSDMSPLTTRFEDVGLAGGLMKTWFANVLRDGFALTLAGGYADFASVARAALITLLSANGGHSSDADHVLAGIGELPLHPDVPPGIERLHSAGFRLVALTNGSRDTTRLLLERGGVAERIAQILSIDDVERWKPAPETYRYALERCSVEPNEAMLVAVHPWDVNGAKRTGMRGAWVNREGTSYPDVMLTPDVEASDFMSLADAVLGRAG